MPPSPSPASTHDLLAIATAAIAIHHATSVPIGAVATPRTELDALHAHLVALHGLMNTHTTRTAPVAEAEGDHLKAVRTRLWQALEHLHAAYHTAPRPGSGRIPTREECRAGLPEGAPELSLCRRHLTASVLVRRQTTPAELDDPFTGLTRH